MPGPVTSWNLQIERSSDRIIVRLQGENIALDESNTEALRESLYQLVEESDVCPLFLDFANISFLSSTTLGMLLTVRRKWLERGGRLVLCNMSPEIREVFEITKLNALFELG